MSEPTTLGGIQDQDTLPKIFDHDNVLTEEQAQYVYKEIDPMNGLSLKTKKKSVPKIKKKKNQYPTLKQKKNQYWRKKISI